MARKPANKYVFDTEAANKVQMFFESYLHHVKGKWAHKPFTLLPWQRDDLLRPVFGWKHAKTGLRRYRTVYVEIPRKNGKSSVCAGIALYLLLADGEAGAEVYSCAADREQATIVFSIAQEMSEQHESLRQRIKHYRTSKTLLNGSQSATYKAISADAFTKHGLNAHGIIFDELHAQPNRDLWDVMTTSTGSREQPLTVAITTAGHDRNSVCWEMHQYAEQVRDGIIQDDTFMPLIYAAGPDDDWTKRATWIKANPSLGETVSFDYMKQKCDEAQNSAAKENVFKRLHLNIWTQQDVRWLRMTDWDACASQRADLDGKPCYAGLDLASTTDIASMVLVFPDDDGACDLVSFFWIPEHAATQRERRNRELYLAWIKSEHMRATPGNIIDYDIIRRDINGIAKQYDIREIAVDRWNSTQLQTQLDGDGFDVMGFGQGYASMSAPTKEFEKLVIGGKLRHGDNPVMRWMAANVAVETDAAGNLKPSKRKSLEKIDGVVAAVMGIGRAMVQHGKSGRVYPRRELLTI